MSVISSHILYTIVMISRVFFGRSLKGFMANSSNDSDMVAIYAVYIFSNLLELSFSLTIYLNLIITSIYYYTIDTLTIS